MNEEEAPLFKFKYLLTSGDALESEQFFNRFKINIDAEFGEESNLKPKTIGKATVTQVLLDFMVSRGINVEEVLDADSQMLLRVVSELFDFEETQFYNPKISEAFTLNICIIETIILEKDYRGKGIAKHLIADIAKRFAGTSAVLALESFPLQFDKATRDNPEDGHFFLTHTSGLESNEIAAREKLDNYYKSIGFKRIKPGSNLFYIPMAFKNKTLDQLIAEHIDW